jgi:hypothetical protein
MVRHSGLNMFAAALLMTAAGTSEALAAQAAPARSDGSSGSFNAQFGNGEYLVWFNVDNGQVYSAASGGYVAFTVPYKVRAWNGQTFHAYNFTDITVQPSVSLKIVGSSPAMFLARTNISIAGQLTFVNGVGAGGAAPSSSASPYNGGAGMSPTGKMSGGGGGDGQIGQIEGCGAGETITAGGGGGGGNVLAGGDGLAGDYPADGPGPVVHNKRGKGGPAEVQSKLQGGEGGGAGAVVFSAAGTTTIASGGVVDSSGVAGTPSAYGTGSSGGGAGGDAWFYSVGAFVNDGTLNLSGGAGGSSTYTSENANCRKQVSVAGPNGGAGSGGFLQIEAPSITNDGTIKTRNGDGSDGGLVSMIGKVAHGGTIIGADTWAIPK